jgi:universal stress protein A
MNGADVALLYVVPTPAYVGGEYGIVDYSAIEAAMRAAGEQNLATFLTEEVRGKAPTESVVRSGSPSVEIVKFAKSWPADVIVIATHGNTGLKHVLLGSVAEQIVRHGPCPVLVVREHEHEFVEA